MGSLPEGEYLARSHHTNLLQSLGLSNNVIKTTLLRSYSRSFNGFAANITPSEVSKLKSMEGVAFVFQSHEYYLQTTRSWDYMGLSLDVPRNLKIESDIIIGHIDSGVLPDMESLADHGLGNIPTKWKGVCLGGKNFTCNKKLIGARYYAGDSAMDILYHGTHTASTAVGRVVRNANFYGIANGTARGGVPSSRIASYRACEMTCTGRDIMAAFDDAIADGVDIITISIAPFPPLNLSEDAVAIGSFHAMEKGILTVQGAGNIKVHMLKSVLSFAPWVFTVGASTTDRKIINKLVLGNGRILISTTINPFDTGNLNKNLVYGKGISRHCNESSAMQCMEDCIDPYLVKGKIMVCDVNESKEILSLKAMSAGASGVIFRKGDVGKDIADVSPMPTAFLNDPDFRYIESYLKSEVLPSARILKSESIKSQSPILVSLSSRGPNIILPEILKPDVVAPGITILAESPTENLISMGIPGAKYNIHSGTSMACPHVTGAASFVKSKHPDWSISAIKSSLMTTAWNMNNKYNPDAELGHGAGHIDPLKAVYPGLVYETSIDEYFNLFCTLGSEGEKLRKMFGSKQTCPKGIRLSAKDLNYPTMTAPVTKNSSFNIQFSRVVTNVGCVNSTYHAQVSKGDNGISINVEPSILSFITLNERKNFVVTVTGQWLNQDHLSYSLVWFDGTHSVRSPIILYQSSIL
ncbi:subtilisin-like protease SBT4.3 [Impatiens glandulifera]|uniref:subtilisin-like protease SBT4.3 n=1 Tax=Impatiens glandulifera TaxID=253017 RepID=UPI001FB14223|nr:subtilisin-like protease SBT4.3 [Impatiens glandulifera]